MLLIYTSRGIGQSTRLTIALLNRNFVSPFLKSRSFVEIAGSKDKTMNFDATEKISHIIEDSVGISREKSLNLKTSASFRQHLHDSCNMKMYKSFQFSCKTHNIHPSLNKLVRKFPKNSNSFHNFNVYHPLGSNCQKKSKEISASVSSFPTYSPIGSEGDQEWWHLSDSIEQNLPLPEEYSEKLEVLQEKFGIRFRSRELLFRALIHESYYNSFMPLSITHGTVERPKSAFGSTLTMENLRENIGKGHEEEILPRDHQIGEEQPLDTDVDIVLGFAAHSMIRSQLEFLGDSVIHFATTDYLVRRHPLVLTGILTKRRSSLVSNKNIGKVGIRNLGLLEGILTEPPFRRPSFKDLSTTFSKTAQVAVVADGVEMLVGAVYIEQGIVGAITFVSTHLLPLLENAIESGDEHENLETHVGVMERQERERPEDGNLVETGEVDGMEEVQLECKDPISALQMLSQKSFHSLPVYKEAGMVLEGTSQQQFRTRVYVEGIRLSTGLGSSKNGAKRDGATKALEKWKEKFPFLSE